MEWNLIVASEKVLVKVIIDMREYCIVICNQSRCSIFMNHANGYMELSAYLPIFVIRRLYLSICRERKKGRSIFIQRILD